MKNLLLFTIIFFIASYTMLAQTPCDTMDVNIIQNDTTICNSDSLLLQLNGYCDSSQPIIGNLLYSATQSFGSSWNINWSVNVASDYILRVVGMYGIANYSNNSRDRIETGRQAANGPRPHYIVND